jgi:hypothetical protein
MKKLLLFSLFIIASAAMTSCTADPIQDANPAHVMQADGGSQTGPTLPPKP